MGRIRPSTRSRRALSLPWLATILALAGCGSQDWSLTPISARSRAEGTTESWGLGPFFEHRRLADEHPDRRTGRAVVEETALHPFFRKYRTLDEHGASTDFLQILFPLLQHRATETLREWRLLWLWWFRQRSPPGQEPEWDLFAPPLFAGGGGEPDEDYFALFPLFGTVKAFAGFERLLFVLFPLYYQVRKDISAPATFHNITPLIGWTQGGPKDGSWRVLPFYARWLHAGRSEHRSVLWPLVHWGRRRLDQPDPANFLTVFPFFSWERSARHLFLGYLYPFFRIRDERVPAREFEGEVLREARHHYRYDLPWPLLRFERTRGFERQRIFPLYSRYRSEELDSDSWLIPLIWKREERRSDWTKRTFDVVPLFHRESRSYSDGRPTDRQVRLWPLVEWAHEGAGTRRLRFPILVPSDARASFRELAANVEPLFELYHDERRPDGSRRTRALFHLIDYRRDPSRTRFSLPVLYSYESSEGRRRHDLLWGLIRFGSGRGGPELRLLFLPLLEPETKP